MAASFNPLYHLVELVRARLLRLRGNRPPARRLLVAFALVLWRVAVVRMTARLID